MFKTWSGWDKYGILDNKTEKDNTVEPRFADTPLFRTVFFVPGESHTFSLNSTRLIHTPVNADNGHFSPNQ